MEKQFQKNNLQIKKNNKSRLYNTHPQKRQPWELKELPMNYRNQNPQLIGRKSFWITSWQNSYIHTNISQWEKIRPTRLRFVDLAKAYGTLASYKLEQTLKSKSITVTILLQPAVKDKG